MIVVGVESAATDLTSVCRQRLGGSFGLHAMEHLLSKSPLEGVHNWLSKRRGVARNDLSKELGLEHQQQEHALTGSASERRSVGITLPVAPPSKICKFNKRALRGIGQTSSAGQPACSKPAPTIRGGEVL